MKCHVRPIRFEFESLLPIRFVGKILVLDLQQNSGKTAENVLKLIILLIKSGFVERKCVILLLCCVIW